MKGLTFGIAKHPKKPGKLIGIVLTDAGTKYVMFPKGNLTLGKLVTTWARDRKQFRHLNKAMEKKFSKVFKTA